MKVTAPQEYGIRCLLQLARSGYGPSTVTVREVAANEGLSTAYTEKILRILSRAGLAESVRGLRGGYRIARAPEHISVAEVIRALGGLTAPSEICSRFTGNADCCVHLSDCGIRAVWSTALSHIEELLGRVPLAALLQSENQVKEQLKRAGFLVQALHPGNHEAVSGQGT